MSVVENAAAFGLALDMLGVPTVPTANASDERPIAIIEQGQMPSFINSELLIDL